jgi:hypothetical protein
MQPENNGKKTSEDLLKCERTMYKIKRNEEGKV